MYRRWTESSELGILLQRVPDFNPLEPFPNHRSWVPKFENEEFKIGEKDCWIMLKVNLWKKALIKVHISQKKINRIWNNSKLEKDN